MTDSLVDAVVDAVMATAFQHDGRVVGFERGRAADAVRGVLAVFEAAANERAAKAVRHVWVLTSMMAGTSAEDEPQYQEASAFLRADPGQTGPPAPPTDEP